VRRGIAAYQKTMRPQDPEDEGEGSREPGSQESGSGEPGSRKTKGREPGEAAPSAANPPSKMSITQAQEIIAKAKARVQGGKDALIKTVAPASKDPKPRRVAKFLILIGAEQAAKILGDLEPRQVEEVSKEIAGIKAIHPAEAEAILAEFKSLLSSAGFFGASAGGVDAARRILHSAYGPEKGEALLNKSVPGSKGKPFGFMEEYNADQLVFLLKDEQPGAAALVLARLPPKLSADAIGKFPQESQKEVLLRIARQKEVSPDVLESVAGALREKAKLMEGGGEGGIEIDGMQALAAILKQGDYSFGDRLLNELEIEDPEIGYGLKNRLYTLDDVLSVFDRPLAEKLKRMTDKDVAILLKGRSVEFREKILSNVSTGRRHMIVEEGQIMGPVSRRECDEVANRFIAWFRLARQKGDLASRDDEDWVT